MKISDIASKNFLIYSDYANISELISNSELVDKDFLIIRDDAGVKKVLSINTILKQLVLGHNNRTLFEAINEEDFVTINSNSSIIDILEVDASIIIVVEDNGQPVGIINNLETIKKFQASLCPYDGKEQIETLEAYHGFNALVCRVGLKNIEIIERENLKDNSKIMGERLIAGLSALNLEPIGEVRGKGLMVGIDLVSNRSTRGKYQTPLAVRVVEIAYEYGLISRPLNGDIVQLSPALIISETEVDKIVEILGEAINKAYKEKELIG